MVPETYQNPKRANEAARKQTEEGKALKGQLLRHPVSSRALRWGSPGQELPPGHVLQTVTDRIPAGPSTHLPRHRRRHRQSTVGSDNIWVLSSPVLSSPGTEVKSSRCPEEVERPYLEHLQSYRRTAG